jgi:hypothetical protein
MKIDGTCHCGKIAYEAEADPENARICHCTDCQTLTGSAFRANVQVAAGNFRLLRGSLKIYIKKTAESGMARAHAFCGDCGTPIYAAAVENPQSYSLRIGAIRQRAQLPPKRQIWCRSALPWAMNLSGIEKLEKQEGVRV